MDIVMLRKLLEKQNYVFDEEFLLTVYIAQKLQKPLLIEGPAGVGKTEVAKTLAQAFNVELIRLQCYEGLDESKSLYEWNYQKQLLSIQLAATEKKDISNLNENTRDNCKLEINNLFSHQYLLERPLLKAINSEKSNILLIDEIDKADEAFEAFLLELLSDFQVSIPELGTIFAKNKPVVILTSNNTRQLSDALKRRCIYLYIDYPTVEKEIKIIHQRIPQVTEKLASDVAKALFFLRQNDCLLKKPSISEALDWVRALLVLDKKELDQDCIDKTLGFILKNRDDMVQFQKGGAFNEIMRNKHY